MSSASEQDVLIKLQSLRGFYADCVRKSDKFVALLQENKLKDNAVIDRIDAVLNESVCAEDPDVLLSELTILKTHRWYEPIFIHYHGNVDHCSMCADVKVVANPSYHFNGDRDGISFCTVDLEVSDAEI